MQHHTDALIEAYLPDAESEAADWGDPIECAAHFIALYRLACEQPAAFAERLACLEGRASPDHMSGKTYLGGECIRGHDGERFLSNGACVDCSREYKRNERRLGKAKQIPASVRKARRIERYQCISF